MQRQHLLEPQSSGQARSDLMEHLIAFLWHMERFWRQGRWALFPDRPECGPLCTAHRSLAELLEVLGGKDSR
jgi:hypothetical protein